jgi:hypothetical protein
VRASDVCGRWTMGDDEKELRCHKAIPTTLLRIKLAKENIQVFFVELLVVVAVAVAVHSLLWL